MAFPDVCSKKQYAFLLVLFLDFYLKKLNRNIWKIHLEGYKAEYIFVEWGQIWYKVSLIEHPRRIKFTCETSTIVLQNLYMLEK